MKEVKSAYEIKDLIETENIIKRVDCLTPSEDNLELRILGYVRNNPDIFNNPYIFNGVNIGR